MTDTLTPVDDASPHSMPLQGAQLPRYAPALAAGIAVGIAVLAVLLAGCQFGGLNSLDMPGTAGHGAGSFQVEVELPDVSTLPQNSPVMVDDVTVGSVSGIDAVQPAVVVAGHDLDDVLVEVRTGNLETLKIYDSGGNKWAFEAVDRGWIERTRTIEPYAETYEAVKQLGAAWEGETVPRFTMTATTTITSENVGELEAEY